MRNRSIITLILSVTVLFSACFLAKYKEKRTIYYGDSLGYYLYLPCTFIYHNLDDVSTLPWDKEIRYFVLMYAADIKKNNLTPLGKPLNQYTCGVAIMELPFFLAGHAWEKINHRPANGFSDTYENFIIAGDILYALFGLVLIYSILRRYFGSLTSVLTVCILWLGTNLFWFSLLQAGMSHVPLFFLYALLLWLSIKITERPKAFLFILIGLITGLITLMRPTDIICALIPLLYGVYNRETLKVKMQFLYRHRLLLILTALAFIVPLIPQLLYWKHMSGHYLYYSYGNQQFDWTHPHIFLGLFSYKNGWLAYSPVMYFALAGLLLIKSIRNYFWLLYTILPLYIYIIYSWYCYNYINGLGSRPMIHMLPLLAIPLAAVLHFISTRKAWLRLTAGVIILFFASVNLSYSASQAIGNLFSENSSFVYNIHTLYRYKINYNDVVCFDNQIVQPDTDKLVFRKRLGAVNFKDSVCPNCIPDSFNKSQNIYHVPEGDEYAPAKISVVYNRKDFGEAKWLKCSGRFNAPEYAGPYTNMLMTLIINRNGETISWIPCCVNNKIGLADGKDHQKNVDLFQAEMNIWGNVYYFVPLPGNIKDGDNIELSTWNVGKKQMLIDNISLDLYSNK
ncbi:ArnT family glycosyltransferase [Chitinophagaceae bacterium MMS25-I14]